MTDKRFDELLAAYLEADISEEELAEFHSAVHASEPLRRRFQQETRLNVLLRETLMEQVELQSLQQTVTLPAKTNSQSWRRLLVAAAAAVLVISVGISYSIYRRGADANREMGICMSISGSSELSVQRGKQRYRATPDFRLHVGDEVTCDADTQAMLRLSDGSILSMESGAQLALDSDLPKVRLLQGEAFFEIAPRREGMPAFQVLTGHSTVDVMGTLFSLVATGHTELKVYEGSVTMTRHSDKASVEVGSQQMANTQTANLAAEELSRPSMEIHKLHPTDDVTLDRGQREANQHLKVEGKRRIVYLRFDIPDVKSLRSAKLRLTQDIDAGAGTLRFFVGDHSDWNEGNLTKDSAPKTLAEVGQRRGVVRRDQIIEVDVSDAVQNSGPITIIMTLDRSNENDIWFGSRESEIPPQLILTSLAQPTSTQ
ncbi:DUF7594 domain-containing protein [Planctomycetes bacterium CA13]